MDLNLLIELYIGFMQRVTAHVPIWSRDYRAAPTLAQKGTGDRVKYLSCLGITSDVSISSSL